VDLRKSGRVGCARCYEVFRKQLLPLLKRIHGSSVHEQRGADPALGRLREELRRAIEAEDFEQAARLRDRITSGRDREIGSEGEDREPAG
jgi:protein arginine kinase activator